MGRLDGKVAIVTGGASGIGKASALALAAEGAKIMVTDIDDPAGHNVVSSIKSKGGTAVYQTQDVVDEARWDEIVAETQKALGPLNITVNNAGIAIGGVLTEYTLDDWRRQHAVNVDSVFLGTRASVRAMRENGGGSIINLSSLAGLRGSSGLSAYCSTKGAVRLFTKSAAVEFARLGYNVRVNSVHPGIIDTPIWEKEVVGLLEVANEIGGFGGVEVETGANRLDVDDMSTTGVPMGKAGQASDIADGIVFLASDESKYMTGAEIVIDGGIYAGA